MRGVYQATITRFDGSELVYVGSSNNITGRQREHLRELRKGTHHSTYFQRAFNKYGERALGWQTLVVVSGLSKAELMAAEQGAINAAVRDFGRRRVMNGTLTAYRPSSDPAIGAKISAALTRAAKTRYADPDEMQRAQSRARTLSYRADVVARRAATLRARFREDPILRSNLAEAARKTMSSRAPAMLAANSKVYALRGPDGTLHEGTNLSELCRSFGLDNSTMNKVNRGDRRSYKGWRRA